MNKTFDESEIMIVSTKGELLSFGYLYSNMNKEVIYEGRTFLLKLFGIRTLPVMPPIPFMGYPTNYTTVIPRKPEWTVKMCDLTLIVSDIL